MRGLCYPFSCRCIKKFIFLGYVCVVDTFVNTRMLYIGKENIWKQLRTNEGSKTRWPSRAQHKTLDTHRLPISKYIIQTYIHTHSQPHTHAYTCTQAHTHRLTDKHFEQLYTL